MDGLVYIGDGSVWHERGKPVPSRDLSKDEVRLYGGKRSLVASGLYARPEAPPIESQQKDDEVKDNGY